MRTLLSAFAPSGALLLGGSLFLSLSVAAAASQRVERTFRVGENATLTVINSSLHGSVTVRAWGRSEIRVLAEMASRSAIVDAHQEGQGVIVRLRKKGRAPLNAVHLTIDVPAQCAIEVSTMGGPIVVEDVRGRVKAFTASGNIELKGVASPSIDAISCTDGNVVLSGDLAPQGVYSLYSAGGIVEVVVPETSSFTLDAATHEGRIDSGAFRFSSENRTATHVEGIYGKGSSLLKLRTNFGHIRLRKK